MYCLNARAFAPTAGRRIDSVAFHRFETRRTGGSRASGNRDGHLKTLGIKPNSAAAVTSTAATAQAVP
jgi:hypothetical protein